MGSSPAAEAALPPAVLLLGPTAAGKTAAAMALCDKYPVRLISVDSAQVYRGLDVGAAKPEPALLARYPHELLDLRSPEQSYSAADFVADAEAAMRRAAAAGQLPVLVGGTMLYVRALLYGLDPLPSADPEVRRRIAERAETLGWEALHGELARQDPVAAARIRPSDRQRVQRALEVLELTGRSLSSWQSGKRRPRFASLRVVLTTADRAILHERIAERFESMLRSGLVDEVAGLRERPGLTVEHPAMRSVGYRQVWDMLDGRFAEHELRARVTAATRQLAKRQLTALRRFPATLWYDSGHSLTIERLGRQVGGFCRRSGR